MSMEDILGNMKNNSKTDSGDTSNDILEYLKAINAAMQTLAKHASNTSQSDARSGSQQFGKGGQKFGNGAQSNANSFKGGYKQASKQFSDSFEKSIMEGFFGADFKSRISDTMKGFANSVGLELEDIPGSVGKELGKQLTNAFKNSEMGKVVSGKAKGFVDNIFDSAKGGFDKGTAGYAAKAAASGAEATAEGSLVSGLAGAAKGVAGAAAPLIAAFAAVELASIALGPALDGIGEGIKGAMKASGRYNASRQANIDNAQKRLQEDVNTIIKKPFEILQASAQEVYDAWDKNVRLINQTQGYNKADLQNLMGAYAERLRDEGLSSVVSASDITENLSKVLESGLSGKAAEEFAYLATKLNAAIPTQDFFSYASTYSSLAANAIRQGQSQSDAINYANQQMELFASDVLYASRQLSGGFTTGLKDAQHLFDQSVQIAQASKTGNPSQIAGVMTAVAAVTGAIAPDLAQSMTDAVMKAATGGNSPDIVALRSLAGVNASNTEFLKEVAADPQKVFSTLFSNLAKMQNMSNDSFMEVAEGLSSVFGVSMDAFSRIDFNYLANAISSMNVSDAALEENLKHLASGESTTSAEQMKMQQINKYLIDNGLSYVMDNEAARAIQQHMWDEQMARDLMEATYAVELAGSSAKFLEGIAHTVDIITQFLTHPIATLTRGVQDLKVTSDQIPALAKDIGKVIKEGQVGSTTNKESYSNLVTRNKNLHVTPDLLTLMGSSSSFYGIQNEFDKNHILNNPYREIFLGGLSLHNRDKDGISSGGNYGPSTGVSSAYSWGSIGKSTAYAVNSMSAGLPTGTNLAAVPSSSNNTQKAKSATQLKIEKMMSDEYINKFISEGKSYDDWVKSAKNLNIQDFDKALQDAGYSDTKVKGYFQDKEMVYGSQEKMRRDAKEEKHWDTMEEYDLQMIDLITYNNKVLDDLYAKHKEFYDAWVDYFVKHTAYSAAYSHSDVLAIQQKESGKSSDAVYALAEALTKNSVDLLDPTVQTNAILSQILLVVNAIMQQNNKTEAGMSLPDTLSGLALGLINKG